MLPSFRLIAAKFFCSFLVVFVGLRMAASLNDLHEGLPVMAAHAAPVPVTPAADREARRGASAVPVMYDLRFAVTPVSPILVRSTPTLIERARAFLQHTGTGVSSRRAEDFLVQREVLAQRQVEETFCGNNPEDEVRCELGDAHK